MYPICSPFSYSKDATIKINIHTIDSIDSLIPKSQKNVSSTKGKTQNEKKCLYSCYQCFCMCC